MKTPTINSESLTLKEWLAAAGLSDARYTSMYHEEMVKVWARLAWLQGEDPTEERASKAIYNRKLP